jgi:uncharacterized cupin superfamily protein
LDLVQPELHLVHKHDVVGGGDGSLVHHLGDEEEVVPVLAGHAVVEDGAGRRVFRRVTLKG